MYRFYYEPENKTDKEITVTGEDAHHIKNVLRLAKGEKAVLCDGAGLENVCSVSDFTASNDVVFEIIETRESENELPVKIVLYQGLPKKDKMELIIQKAVELGAYEIVPVAMKRSIAKIEDDKSEKKKLARWQEISRAAAKQSGRGIIPEIGHCLTFKQALKEAFEGDSVVCAAYENARGMKSLEDYCEVVKKAPKGSKAAVFIGPEGGFEESEIEEILNAGGSSVSLGKRILRTETAGLTLISILMYELETDNELLS